MNKIIVSLALLISLCFSSVFAQSGTDMLNLDYLFVGAHPDDEGGFTGTMARYNLDEGFKGSIANFTLGEGGGNALGPEVGASLGLIRYEELRRSLAVAGVDRFYYLGFEDFYFTQSADLTHKMWSEQNPDYLCELIRVVRITRPEVIVTMWPGPGTHGHHQMAARSAIRAFNLSGDANTCPGLIEDEYLETWQPLKLYISAPQGRNSIEVPLDEFSRTHNMSYAELRSIALRNFRTQGWDRWNTIPPQQTSPESRLLVKSLVPIGDPETHFLEGTHLPAGSSPPGVKLMVDTESYRVNAQNSFQVNVQLDNHTNKNFEQTSLKIDTPEGWSIDTENVQVGNLGIGESFSASFTLTPTQSLELNNQQQVWVQYSAGLGENRFSGKNHTWIEPVSPISVQVHPLFDIQQYREFAVETNTEWLTPNLPTRIPLSHGLNNEVMIQLHNQGEAARQGEIDFELPDGVSAEGDMSFSLEPGQQINRTLIMNVSDSAFPDDSQSLAATGSITASSGNYTATENLNLYLLPFLEIEKTESRIQINGDLDELKNYTTGNISHTDLWSGNTAGPDDSSADFYLAYDDENLYFGVRVYDDNVLCHMPPDRIRNHWYGDAIELTIDPSGDSSDVSTTYRASIFPCSTEGFEPNAARYGDANSGPIDHTAPGMEVASKQTDDGYIIETAIPWSSMAHKPGPSDDLRFNLLIYDADEKNPETGADYGKSRIGWGSVLGAQQATTYAWPTVRLKP